MSLNTETTLGEITVISTGKLDANAEHKDGQYPFFTCGDETLRINDFAFDAEAVLLAGNGNFGIKYYSGKFNAYQRTYVIQPVEVCGKWLYYCVSHYISKITSGSRGSTIKYLRLGDISDCKIILPPLNQQKKTVAKVEELLSELDNGIKNLKTALEQLKVYRQTVLKHAFEGKLTADWRAQNKDKLETADQLLARIKAERETRYQQQLIDWKSAVKAWETDGRHGKKPSRPRIPKIISKLGLNEIAELEELPDGWVWDKLGWMTCGVEYGTAAKSSETGAVAVLRMGNIQNARFDWADLVYTSDEEEIKKYSLKSGDVLFNRTNSPELVGKTAIYRGEQSALFAGYLIRVNHIQNVVDSQYLNLFLNSHTAKHQGNKVKTDGVNQSNINGEKLSNYPFPYCSLAEQQAVVRILDEKLSVTDQLQREIETELLKCESLRQSVLKKAFSGLLVEQDPNDEPAAVLLERIKAEKAATPKPKSTTRARKSKVKKEAVSMANLMSVIKAEDGWIRASEAFAKCGIGNGSETDAIEKLYEELRGFISSNKVTVERRGDEDWMILNREKAA